jgi:hypothetical protein
MFFSNKHYSWFPRNKWTFSVTLCGRWTEGNFLIIRHKGKSVVWNPLGPYSFHLNLNQGALGYGLDDWGFESRQVLRIFLFTTTSRPALGPTQPPTQWVPGALSLEVKRPGSEANHSLSSNAEVKNAWSCISRRGAQLKHGGNFTFTFTFTFRVRWAGHVTRMWGMRYVHHL